MSSAQVQRPLTRSQVRTPMKPSDGDPVCPGAPKINRYQAMNPSLALDDLDQWPALVPQNLMARFVALDEDKS